MKKNFPKQYHINQKTVLPLNGEIGVIVMNENNFLQ